MLTGLRVRIFRILFIFPDLDPYKNHSSGYKLFFGYLIQSKESNSDFNKYVSIQQIQQLCCCAVVVHLVILIVQ